MKSGHKSLFQRAVTFSVKIVTDGWFDPLHALSSLPEGALLKIAVMLAFAGLLGGARMLLKSPLVTPVAFFGFAIVLNAILQAGYLGDEAGWYLSTTHGLAAWVPIAAIQTEGIQWSVYWDALPELATCVFVGLISLVVRISTFEASRMAAADLNHELRIYGLSSLLSGPAGGMTGGILFSTSKFLADSSAKTRFVYVIIAALLALLLFAELDLSQLVPTPILGGFLLLLGYAMTAEALKVTLRQRSVLEIVLAAAILVLCLWLGFIVGAVAGFVTACLLFAFSYARIGVIRRHSTRRSLGAATERPHEIEAIIREQGDSIHVFELEGYVFFGSSEVVFAHIQRRHRAQKGMPIRFLILDLSHVTGYDSSATNTLNKMRGYCARHGIALALCGMRQAEFRKLMPEEGPARALYFRSAIEALDWAEEGLLQALGETAYLDEANGGLVSWLSMELDLPVGADVVDAYFTRIEAPAGEVLYRQGDRAESIDFVVSGAVAIIMELGFGHRQIIRRSTRQTIIGEMGFFRQTMRVASVVADSPTLVCSLERTAFERLRNERLDIYDGLLHYFIRILSDRLETATVELTTTRHVDDVDEIA